MTGQRASVDGCVWCKCHQRLAVSHVGGATFSAAWFRACACHVSPPVVGMSIERDGLCKNHEYLADLKIGQDNFSFSLTHVSTPSLIFDCDDLDGAAQAGRRRRRRAMLKQKSRGWRVREPCVFPCKTCLVRNDYLASLSWGAAQSAPLLGAPDASPARASQRPADARGAMRTHWFLHRFLLISPHDWPSGPAGQKSRALRARGGELLSF